MKSMDDKYWASADSKEIADKILEKVDNFYEYLQLSGRLDLYRRSYAYYYRPRATGGRLNSAGEQGELTAFSVNHYRNLLLHLETLTLQQRPYFEARATNSDVKSQAQVILANNLMDYYLREKRLERNIKQCVKEGLMFSEGYVRVEWDTNGGDKYGVTPTGADVMQGDIKYTNYNTLDVIRDYTKTYSNQDDWYILRDFKNKFDLAEQFPELKDDILSDSNDDVMINTTTFMANALEESDNISVFTLLHRPTRTMKNGRFTVCLNNGTVLMDGPIPYSKTHVYRLAPDEESGTPFGYTVGFDLLSIQEAIDILYSTAISNQATFGVQNVLIPKGADINTSQLSGGMNVTEYDPKVGKPEPMNLLATPPEIFNFIQQLEKVAETISGVNSVARGNPEASLKSGAALALVQSMAIQFSMNLQQSYIQICEELGTATIEILKDFASVPRVAEIVGKSNRPLMKWFTGEELSEIKRVTVDIGNPLTRTIAGKVNMADSLMEKNLIENSDQYIQVVTTGRLEPVIESKKAELILIKDENERLAAGEECRALITDKHDQHILEHRIVLANPDLRNRPNDPVVMATLNHIQEHITMLQTADPVLMQLIRQQSLAPTQAQGPGQMMNPQPAIEQQAQDVQMPNMPTNPMTGEQAQIPQV